MGYALWRAGAAETLTYFGRRPEPPAHPVFSELSARYNVGLHRPGPETTAVLLAVPDSAVGDVAAGLAARGSAPVGCAAFHLSGALTVEVLRPLHEAGYEVGSVHPLQSVADPVRSAEALRGCFYAVAGGPDARAVARRLLGYLDARILEVPERKRPVYHAAAVMASNYLAVLLDTASRLLEEAGIRADEALPALLPLAKGTLDNIASLGIGPALTGPIVRGDVETVRLHVQMLPEPERALYCALGRGALELAERAGLDKGAASRLRTLVECGDEVLRQR